MGVRGRREARHLLRCGLRNKRRKCTKKLKLFKHVLEESRVMIKNNLQRLKHEFANKCLTPFKSANILLVPVVIILKKLSYSWEFIFH
jgi:hypothetical protein